jgi:cytochrome bd-type quinol oxidase subunit 1
LSFKSKIEREMRRICENTQFRVSYTQKHEDLTVKSKVKIMSDRIKILGVFALLGFVGGVLANVSFHTVWPWLLANFPLIFSAEWVISGMAGALITTFFVVIWVYLSKPSAE